MSCRGYAGTETRLRQKRDGAEQGIGITCAEGEFGGCRERGKRGREEGEYGRIDRNVGMGEKSRGNDTEVESGSCESPAPNITSSTAWASSSLGLPRISRSNLQ